VHPERSGWGRALVNRPQIFAGSPRQPYVGLGAVDTKPWRRTRPIRPTRCSTSRSRSRGTTPPGSTWPCWTEVEREGGAAHLDDLHRVGVQAGDPVHIHEGELANRFTPELHNFDRFGHRIDDVEYHPAYHSLMTVAVREGLAGSAWTDERPGAHVGRAAKFAVWTQVEAGHGCPISMTYSIVPALRAEPSLSAAWEPLLASHTYDPAARPALGPSRSRAPSPAWP